ncbi:complex 1 protein (LYR family) domain-containing protein [Phthorimaea operculella]|nr:complex 1 protein (LYR family) domain-containing protein [Phthorimaea operculella]
MSSKTQVLSLYKSLMRESGKFGNYNFRCYALRRVRDAFKENKSLTDPNIAKREIQYAKENLDIIKRQVIIGNMYGTDKLVIENMQ